jgi:hypothetical protein
MTMSGGGGLFCCRKDFLGCTDSLQLVQDMTPCVSTVIQSQSWARHCSGRRRCIGLSEAAVDMSERRMANVG